MAEVRRTDLEEHAYVQGRGDLLITHGAMKHNWGLEFQETEREEEPNDYLRSIMVVMNQRGEPKKLPGDWGCDFFSSQHLKTLNAPDTPTPQLFYGICFEG